MSRLGNHSLFRILLFDVGLFFYVSVTTVFSFSHHFDRGDCPVSILLAKFEVGASYHCQVDVDVHLLFLSLNLIGFVMLKISPSRNT